MVLTDVELAAEIDAKRLCFFPPLEPGQINICTIDLRLGNVIRELKPPPKVSGVHLPGYIQPEDLDWSKFLLHYTQLVDCSDGYYDLERDKPVLAWTREKITLPSHLCARVEGRSSLARLGLTVHNTAPFIHPGFSNHLALELHWRGLFPLRLGIGEERICQLIVERMSGVPTELYSGQFQGP